MGFAIGHNQKSRILIFENQADDVRIIQQAFKEEPNVVLEFVYNMEDALDFLKQQNAHRTAKNPHLVIIGSGFGKTEQLELLKEMKDDQSLKKIPVVILNTSASEQDISEAYALHVNCYMVKPTHAEGFTKMLHIIEQYWITTALLHSI